MAKTTRWFGLALVVLGIVGFIGSGAESLTALIPSVIGLVLAGLGFAGQVMTPVTGFVSAAEMSATVTWMLRANGSPNPSR